MSHNPTPPTAGTVVLIHGGYWRAPLTSELMNPIAIDLESRGYATANIEYRRPGAGGGWPFPLEDTISACERVARDVAAGTLPGPLFLLGHSVGGQLALLAGKHLGASTVAGIITLAPVTNLVDSWRIRAGDDAVRELLAASPGDPMEIAAEASPQFQLPIGVPTHVIHGANDARVPIAHSREFTAAAHALGERVTLTELSDLDHVVAIDPSAPHWSEVLATLADLRSGAREDAHRTES